jgi:serine/threonine-protein kinase HipA
MLTGHVKVFMVFLKTVCPRLGRRLMVRRHKLGRKEQRVPNLLKLLGNQGLGALSYVEEGGPELKTTGVSCQYLQELALLARKFDQEPATASDNELSLL